MKIIKREPAFLNNVGEKIQGLRGSIEFDNVSFKYPSREIKRKDKSEHNDEAIVPLEGYFLDLHVFRLLTFILKFSDDEVQKYSIRSNREEAYIFEGLPMFSLKCY